MTPYMTVGEVRHLEMAARNLMEHAVSVDAAAKEARRQLKRRLYQLPLEQTPGVSVVLDCSIQPYGGLAIHVDGTRVGVLVRERSEVFEVYRVYGSDCQLPKVRHVALWEALDLAGMSEEMERRAVAHLADITERAMPEAS